MTTRSSSATPRARDDTRGRVGALVCELRSGVSFNVGTGLSDAQREAPPEVGAIIVVRYQELTRDQVPRFPSFVGVRHDMKWDGASATKPSPKKSSAKETAAKKTVVKKPAAKKSTSDAATASEAKKTADGSAVQPRVSRIQRWQEQQVLAGLAVREQNDCSLWAHWRHRNQQRERPWLSALGEDRRREVDRGQEEEGLPGVSAS